MLWYNEFGCPWRKKYIKHMILYELCFICWRPLKNNHCLFMGEKTAWCSFNQLSSLTHQNKFFGHVKVPPVNPILVHFKATLTKIRYDAITSMAESQENVAAGMYKLQNSTWHHCLTILPIEWFPVQNCSKFYLTSLNILCQHMLCIPIPRRDL